MCRMWCVLVVVVLCMKLVCSWDFAVSRGDEQLSLYTNEVITSTITIKQRNLTALAYDEVHNTMLFVDKQPNGDTICGYNFTSTENKCFTERNGKNIHGIAYDPVTESVFFTDSYERSVNWFSLRPGSNNKPNTSGNILLDDGIPRAIVVDSCKGYMYWLTTNTAIPTIERARLNGAVREVVEIVTSIPGTNNTYLEPHSLAIDQQTKAIYWMEPYTTTHYKLVTAEINRKNKTSSISYGSIKDQAFITPLNSLTISKTHVILMDFINKIRRIHKFPKDYSVVNTGFAVQDETTPVYIVANYKITDQTNGIEDCSALRRVNSAVENSAVKDNSGDLYCVHGIKVKGQSICKCRPGYIGKRCEASVCMNYCFQGRCRLNNAGLPECRCNAGYSGDRCEVNVCHGRCLNDGRCYLNKKREPICKCKGNYVGERCQTSACENYCLHGYCSINDAGLPQCRCKIGYTGDRCHVDACQGYCLNDGLCYLNEEDDPACICVGSYEGIRCETDKNDTLKNVTLADLLLTLHKRPSEILVNLAVKSEDDDIFTK